MLDDERRAPGSDIGQKSARRRDAARLLQLYFCQLRQAVSNLEPRRFRSHEHVSNGPNARIIVEGSQRKAELFRMISKERRQRRSAHAAEAAGFSGRRLVPGQQFFASRPSKRCGSHRDTRAKCCAGRFAAHRAVTVHGVAQEAIDFVANATAQTAAPEAHRSASSSTSH